MGNSLKATLNVSFGFLPLILLWSISSKLGLVLGLLTTLIMFINKVVDRNIGIMPWVLLAYFTTSNILYFCFKVDFIINYRYLTSYIVLSLMGFISIMLARPYTMYEASSGYEKEFTKSPLFIEVNIFITKIWTTIYLINAMIEMTAYNSISIIIMNILVALGVALSIAIPALLPEA